MGKAHVTVFCGNGRGKTSAALGQGIFGASAGKSVIIIQFLKGKIGERIDFIKRLEPEIKAFCFEKSDVNYEALSPEEQKEEAMNIRNGLNFARKVLTTDGCDVLILDEVLSVGDAKFRKKSEKKVLSMFDKGVTVLFVSHSLQQVQRLCNKAMILEKGKLIAYGDIDEISEQYERMID